MRTFSGVEICSGPGGLSQGFMNVKHKNCKFFIAVANDADKNVAKTYTNNHTNTEFVLGSITSEDIKKKIQNTLEKVTGDTKADIVIGGLPCQGFSCANKKTRNLLNPLNQLEQDFYEMIKRVKPFAFVLENVPGILSMQNGKTISKIIRKFKSQGYKNTDYWLLNAVDYGVPQTRKRVFIVGSKSQMKIIPPNETHKTTTPFASINHNSKNQITVWDAISDLPAINSGKKVSSSDKYRFASQTSIQKKLRNGSKAVKNHIVTVNNKNVIQRIRHVPQGGNWQNIPEQMMSLHGQYKNMKNTHSGIYKRLVTGNPSVTISNFRKMMLIHPTQNRLLSVREAARLQTFPDTFEFHGTLSSMQQQVSDAVPVNLAKAVAKAMLSHMEKSIRHDGIPTSKN